jgi:hypothetical protein
VHASDACLWVTHVQGMLCTVATDALQPTFEAASPGKDLHAMQRRHVMLNIIEAVGSCQHNNTPATQGRCCVHQ